MRRSISATLACDFTYLAIGDGDGYYVGIPHKDVDIVFYQAGADAHIKEGFVTFEQIRLRDKLVFEACGEHALPIVWSPTGNYGPLETVFRIQDGTMLESILAFQRA